MTAKPDKSQTGSPAPTGPTDPTPGTFHPDIQSVPLLDRDIAEWVGRAHNRIVENAARCVGLSKRRITRDVVEQIFDDAICSLVEDEGVPLRAVLKARSEVMRGMSAVGAFRGSDLRPIQEINVDLLNMLAREDRITQFVADSAIGLADDSRCAMGSARKFISRAEKKLTGTEPFEAERGLIEILTSVMVHSYSVWSRLGLVSEGNSNASCEACPRIAADALGAGSGTILGGPIGGALLGAFASMVVAVGPDEPSGGGGTDPNA